MTPGRVWIALNGATPGRIFWISVVVIAVADRVAFTPVTMISELPEAAASSAGAGSAGAWAKAGAAAKNDSSAAPASSRPREDG